MVSEKKEQEDGGKFTTGARTKGVSCRLICLEELLYVVYNEGELSLRKAWPHL